jgi:peptidoglycan/xylan/chitin deacetylase (PgdA/CDA1 family)
MYHRIVPDAEANQVLNGLLVTPEVFSDELRALHDDGWTTITLGELAQDMRAGTKPPPKTFVLTFDDGWWDGFTYAAPIMAQYGFVGTFFVITSRGAPNFLSPAQMVSLEAAGNEIGDHSVSHYALGGQTYSVDYSQICAAADTIASNLGHRPASLAYPIGSYDSNALAAAAACPGIEIAVSTVEGATQSWKTRYATPRVRISRASRAPGVLAYLKRLTGQ